MDENSAQARTKFCKHCGAKVYEAAVICPHCGCQIEEINSRNEAAQVVINNSNVNTNTNTNMGYPGGPKPRNKWVAFLLCLFFGIIGVHKFYERKILLGILYIFTLGFFGIGVIIDLIALLFKPNPYYT